MKSTQSIRILISLMSIALLGVIVIQFLWIKNVMEMKEEQFDRSVNAALVRVSADLESKYGVHWITEKLESDSSALREVMSQDPGFYKFMISADETAQQIDSAAEQIQNNIITTTTYKTVNTYSTNSSDNGCLQDKIVMITNVNRAHKLAAMDKSARQQSATEETPETVATPETPETPQAMEASENANAAVKLPKGSRLVSIVKSAADEWAMSKMNVKEVSDALDSNAIMAAIKKEFKRMGLPENFVFATYCTEGDTLMINKASSNNPLHDFAFHAPLMQTDFIDEGSLLLINFPQRYKYLVASMAGMLALSLIFTLSIIAAFAYSLHVIFRQKKLSDITNDFINNMTHELKTPLATISMTADTLALGTVSQNAGMVTEYSGLIKNEVKKLSRHVDRILETALFEKNGPDNKRELISLNQLIEDEVKVFEPMVQQRNGSLTVDLPAEPVVLYANKDLLRCAVTNLIDNALKYSLQVPEISIVLRKSGNKITLRISDKGIGISNADQHLIFEKFYRAPTGNRHDVKGFGLGLSFAKEVVENLGGKIKVESELGKGSSFMIEIPLN